MRVTGPTWLLVPLIALMLGLGGCQGGRPAQEVLHVTNRVFLEQSPDRTPFLPYLNVAQADPGELHAGMVRTSVTSFTVGPITGASGMCTPMWGTSAAQDLVARRNVRSILSHGGSVVLSFSNFQDDLHGSMEQHCGSPAALAAAYGRAVSDFTEAGRVPNLNFLLDDEQLADRGTNDLRAKALVSLQDATRRRNTGAVRASFTLPADPAEGLSRYAVEFLDTLLSRGVEISGVFANVVGNQRYPDRDRASSASGMGGLAVAAACGAVADLQALYSRHGQSLTDAQAWAKTGLMVTIGENPRAPGLPHGILTVPNAMEIAEFAARQSQSGTPLYGLSMWSMNRDLHCDYEGTVYDQISGLRWAIPQSSCNVIGGEFTYTLALSS